MNHPSAYDQASIQTAQDLKTVAARPDISSLSRLSLPEIEVISDLIARYVPAGNVPGVILSGLVRMPAGRQIPVETVQRDIRLMFKGVEQTVDNAINASVFGGPAAVLWAYQNLLKLAGKSQDSAFPEGIWQFYANYALREDTARHANETHGLETALRQHRINLSPVDRLTALVMAAIHALHQYDEMLANEWRERVYITTLQDIVRTLPEAQEYANLYRAWQKSIPYRRGQDAGNRTYPQYRQEIFDRFLQPYLERVSPAARIDWHQRVQLAETQDLPAYQRQMTILATLRPEYYSEVRVALPLEKAHISLYYKGLYHLIPVCAPDSSQPADVATVRTQVAHLLKRRNNLNPVNLKTLARVKRSAQAGLRSKLNPDFAQDLSLLQQAPILINPELVKGKQPLARIRQQAERGAGDHPLTVFDTGETLVFDQSHIFFDGAWGAALAEIMTNETLSWAVYLHSTPLQEITIVSIQQLPFKLQATDQAAILAAPQIAPEVSAENESLNLQVISNLRELLKKRSQDIKLTVNDLLVLYRALHTYTYQPDEKLMEELKSLAGQPDTQAGANAALQSIANLGTTNPALLIPVAADNHKPRERVIPLSFEVPLAELGLLTLHKDTMAALEAYQSAGGDRSAVYEPFYELQRIYLATLAGFGEVSLQAKRTALTGESASAGVIRMLAHLPTPVQRMLDKIPGNFDHINDLIKGREVFSNIGAVAATSTLTRFISAKDDNEKKTLVWGVMTDNRGVTHLSLRDFRLHVSLLQAAGKHDLAARITQDYLDAYVNGLNRYIIDLRRITIASRSAQARTEPL